MIYNSIKCFCYTATFGVILISFNFYDELGYQFKFNVIFSALFLYFIKNKVESKDKALLNQALLAESSEQLGAENYERSSNRSDYRNGT